MIVILIINLKEINICSNRNIDLYIFHSHFLISYFVYRRIIDIIFYSYTNMINQEICFNMKIDINNSSSQQQHNKRM